ncbi:small conserved protein, putative [Perkinsus marinus ATCC 50983]|uniref:Small conserved protein, putative n=1 Tax=Perkinsus marinus (strain ATCC 50983 / TXsc) TaxID=423536 RepID=C5L3K4_PERM5|nr:small conserved protein, putative [Perkinsus marinus ATCC 50983]EER08583.1 small conserved protein, putative [Perkinsus marinus ATCC 50983]|eukprot:XP_002776767.1 small conserved protein, putative [Perkinsus marinus ATCC 50983]
MGRTNACEAQRKRIDNAKRQAKHSGKGGDSQLKNNAASQTLMCSICRQTFMCTQKKLLPSHAESKHPKQAFADCFPGVTV